jgi:peptidoglycan hydrolase-like protein with peptidoglycan-binding domain
MRKTLFVPLLALAFMLGGPVHAQTTTPAVDNATLIQQLQAQIVQLQTQLADLTKKNTDLVQTVQTLQLKTQLHQGMSGEDVRKLQEVLATDPNLFSKDNVTGYYGALTAQAVSDFQKHFGIDSLGIVGPHTLEKLNELLTSHEATSTSDLSENEFGDLGENASTGSSAKDSNTSESGSNKSSSSDQKAGDN